jgi:RNA polymerase sigma-70 factor (ECF subfamily)
VVRANPAVLLASGSSASQDDGRADAPEDQHADEDPHPCRHATVAGLGLRGRSPARAWLLSVARRVIADHIRSLRSRPRSHDGSDIGDQVEPGFAEDVVLNELVGALDPERRTAFVLTQLLGLSYTDAAEVCRCLIGTIRSRVARAREDLVTAIQDDRTDQRLHP